MIVHDLNVMGVSIIPNKANTPLVVYLDTVLPLPIPSEWLRVIPRRRCQIAQLCGSINLAQLSQCDALYLSKLSTGFPWMQLRRIRAFKR